MGLLVCFPIAAFFLFLAISFSLAGKLRVAVMRAATCWAVAVAAITEVLSVLRALTPVGLTIAWLLVDIGIAAYLWSLKSPERKMSPGGFVKRLTAVRGQLGGTGTMFLLSVTGILVLVGLAAVLCPPNTSDAMTYHMPRIVHWLHNRSVAFYATADLRQLKMPPWSEYAMLQLHSLSGTDRFDNLIQWVAMIGSVIGVSLIAEQLGASVRGQMLAALICATIPEGILEASGAKNDYALAFWLTALVYFLFAYHRDRNWTAALGIGASLGLAFLTKTTAFLLAPPLIVSIGLLGHWGKGRRLALQAMTMGALVLALNAGHFLRNMNLFGTPFGPVTESPPKGFKYTNDHAGARTIVSNVVRNAALHVGTPSGAVNAEVERTITRALSLLGADVNDPGATWDYEKFHVPGFSRHEASAGNPLHFLLIVLTLLVAAKRWRRQEMRGPLLLACGLTLGFFLFCAVLKWQPWNTRLHLPLFVLWSAVIGTVLISESRWTTTLLGLALLLFAAPAALWNQIRPFVGHSSIFGQPRTALYFADRGELQQSYTATARYITAQHCRDVGLIASPDQYEYPLLALLRDLDGALNVRYIGVRNQSRIYNRADEKEPCALICPDCPPEFGVWASHFALTRTFGNVVVVMGPRVERKTPDACLFQFTGWYGEETDGRVWWRWTADRAAVHVIVTRPMEASLDGEVLSMQEGNTVDIFVNGGREMQLVSNSSPVSTIKALPLHLKAGDNVIEFVSRDGPVRVPNDDRPLAIAIRGLRTRALDGGTCTIEP